MKLLAVHPGASFATGDVYRGMTGALKRRGHDVQEYRLDWRVDEALEMVKWREKRKKKLQGDEYAADPAGPLPQAIRYASMTLLEATLTVNPHCLLIFTAMFLHPDTMILLRRMGVPIILFLTESPYDDGKQANITPFANMVYTNERASVPLMQRWYEQYDGTRGAKNIEYLPHAYDPDVHKTFEVDEDEDIPRHDVVFVGSGFIERQEMLQAVDWEGLDIDFGLYGKWPYVGTRNHLRKYLQKDVVPNDVAAKLYRKAGLGLNLYRQSVGTSKNATRIKGAESLNPRALELAATGTPHVSDHRPEVTEVFGNLVPTFKTPRQLEQVIGGLIKTKQGADYREQMRRLLPQCVEGWTFDARAEQVERGIAVARST
jgi:glycosyltransferase involved in cell wall biosynthesis